MIECKICNKLYKRIDSVHLPKIHNISVDDYLDMFPGSNVISPESITRYSKAQTEYARLNPILMQQRAIKAKENGYDLVRIRESKSNEIMEI